VPRVSWVKASADDLVNYQSVLSYKLHHIHLPSAAILCNDLLCTNRDHIDAISAYADAISDACLSAANGCIPHTCHQHSKGRIPGWSERVDPFRQKSLLWHKIWDDVDALGQVLSPTV